MAHAEKIGDGGKFGESDRGLLSGVGVELCREAGERVKRGWESEKGKVKRRGREKGGEGLGGVDVQGAYLSSRAPLRHGSGVLASTGLRASASVSATELLFD